MDLQYDDCDDEPNDEIYDSWSGQYMAGVIEDQYEADEKRKIQSESQLEDFF